MRVKLIATTPNPIDVMWTAARTCYSAKSPVEMWEWKYGEEPLTEETYDQVVKEYQDKHLKLVKAVLDSGHMSIAEHVNYTFAIEGISRACSHQLVRHRLCTFSQQSQRYVNEKNGFEFEVPQSIQKIDELHNEFYALMQHIQNFYNKAVEYDIKPEDARSVLPNAAKTNIVVTTNLRNLIHMSELRLCTRAQKEIRQLFKLIKEEVTNNNEVLGNMLMAQCDRLGYCPEASKCCGKRPTLQDNLLSKADWEQLMNACDDPQVNEKIIKLMKMKPAF